MDDKEAADLGFSRQSVESLDQALEVMGFKAAQKIEVSESWSEKLCPVDPAVFIDSHDYRHWCRVHGS